MSKNHIVLYVLLILLLLINIIAGNRFNELDFGRENAAAFTE